MKFKRFVEVKTTEENYKPVVLRRAISICWILLFICFILKLLGGNICDIVCNDEKFMCFCNYVENNLWLSIIIGSISSFVTYSLLYLIICQKKTFEIKYYIAIALITTSCVVVRLLISNTIIKLFINIFEFFVVPIFLPRTNRCEEWFARRLVVANVMNFMFQFVSAITKDLALKINLTNCCAGLYFSIDIYFMLVLYYLYTLKKGGRKMGWFLDWLFGKSDVQLEKMKQQRLDKIAKLQGEIDEINKEQDRRQENK